MLKSPPPGPTECKVYFILFPDKSTGQWTVKVGVYYTAWSGHEGGDCNVYIEGLTQPVRKSFHAKQATHLNSQQHVGDDGLMFMLLATVNITKVRALLSWKNRKLVGLFELLPLLILL